MRISHTFAVGSQLVEVLWKPGASSILDEHLLDSIERLDMANLAQSTFFKEKLAKRIEALLIRKLATLARCPAVEFLNIAVDFRGDASTLHSLTLLVQTSCSRCLLDSE